MDHDQNFKNLVLDYPREALAFFAESEARHIAPDVRITPVREEQLKERLGERFRELDIPLLVEWPDGKRGALVFVVEEESDPKRFSIGRLADYRPAARCRQRRTDSRGGREARRRATTAGR